MSNIESRKRKKVLEEHVVLTNTPMDANASSQTHSTDTNTNTETLDKNAITFLNRSNGQLLRRQKEKMERILQTDVYPPQLPSSSTVNAVNKENQFSHIPSGTSENDMVNLHKNARIMSNRSNGQLLRRQKERMEYQCHQFERHSLGSMNIKCPYCRAQHWIDERLKVSTIYNPKFGTCCKQGKVKLHALTPPPIEFKLMFDGNDSLSTSFQQHIRQYNAANAFTSLGFDLDDRTIGPQGVKSFTIHGELRHRTGSLLPENDTPPVYSQLYIYDPDIALKFRQERNTCLDRKILEIIQRVLLRDNPFVGLYRQAYDILKNSVHAGCDLPVCLHYNRANDKRTYNMPTADEIAVILPGDGTNVSASRDIMIHLRHGSQLQRISECHPAYLPLHYVLLFPNGDLGWDINHTKWDPILNCPTSKRLTQQLYYSYRIFEREDEYSTIIRGRKLFQEFIVDAWASTEQNRLYWARTHQKELRRDLYSGITDIESDILQADQIGKRFVLPSSFVGSPRHMYEIYQDSLAITRFNKHPDIFLTMTANPNWPEIREVVKSNQKPTDRPDIIARVFELKRRALMDEIIDKHIFGKIVAYVYTIEFQKRGLPHMHALFFLHHGDKIRTVEQVNNLISAEFPNKNERPQLFETVLKCMVHGPCKGNKRAPCMENGRCSKRYPREWAEGTTMDQDGYPIYRRRNDGHSYIVKGTNVDNRDVVPYNPNLSELFNCHINVEGCASVRAVKYIHKYIYKGHDRTTLVVGEEDEIKQYLDSRYIGSPEAAWHIFGYHMHEEKPTVTRLHLHLPGMHHVIFDPTESSNSIRSRAENQTSTLIEFFKYCQIHEDARQFTYQQFPQYFTWNKSTRKWSRRIADCPAIGRMYFASPNSGERFYLRLLLTVTKGPTSFEDLRTVNGELHSTFKDACFSKGMLEDDEEWVLCLEEASVMNTGYQLRRLFCIILTECVPLQPLNLWNIFAKSICDDLDHDIRIKFQISNPSESEIWDYGLHLINKLLQECGKCLSDFPPMPLPTKNWDVVVGNRLLWEHKQLQYEGQEAKADKNILTFNDGQRYAYDEIFESVRYGHGTTFFLNGGAGTGKTYVYNTLADKCRSLGHVVITVASSGIASLLLMGGRTAHSTFSIPLDIIEDSVCGFTKQSITAELLRKTSLIIWDEVPMQHRYCVETVDRSLKDIRDNKKSFGGVTVVLGGDFRQILPVIPRGLREDIVAATLRRSPLWCSIKVLTLHKNMRLNSDDLESSRFATYLDQIGSSPDQTVNIRRMHKCHTLNNLIQTIYPGLNGMTPSPTFLTERTILTSRNDDVNAINSACLKLSPSNLHVFLAADKMVEDEENDRFPSEFLNSLECSGLPLFKLELKVGCPIMLLRNLAPKDGLCNGTRLVVVRCATRIIEAQILTGDKAGKLVFIPRISLQPSSREVSINMSRRQFPIKLAYSMTINKAQGQSVKYVGVDLRTPVFTHGQLYVALSRCTNFSTISLLLPPSEDETTTNIVYPEVLL